MKDPVGSGWENATSGYWTCLLRIVSLVLFFATCASLSAASLQEVYSFPSIPTPISGLVLAGDGALYGVTSGGGAHGYGSVFRVGTNGVMSTMASFTYTNGANPVGTLTVGQDGALYGVTERGGTNDCGTVVQVTTNGGLRDLTSFQQRYWTHPYPQETFELGWVGGIYGAKNGFGAELFCISTSGLITTLAFVHDVWG